MRAVARGGLACVAFFGPSAFVAWDMGFRGVALAAACGALAVLIPAGAAACMAVARATRPVFGGATNPDHLVVAVAFSLFAALAALIT